MENQYLTQTSRWWLTMVGILGLVVSTRAQTTLPPVIQWQRTLNGGELTASASVRAVKANDGGYAVLTGKSITKLLSTGDIIWTKQLLGSYLDSTGSYAPIRETRALTATPDGGFVVLGLDLTNRYYVAKVDSAGNGVWTRTINNAGTGARITENTIITAPDGSLLVVGAFNDAFAYLSLTKLNQEGVIAGQWRINYPGSPTTTLVIRKILNTNDGGYLLVGKAADKTTSSSQGLAIKLTAKYNLVWKNTYPGLDSLSEVVANPSTDGVYTGIGPGAGGISRLISITPAGTGDGNLVATVSESTITASLANDQDGNLTVLDGTSSHAGDFRLSSVNQASIQWTKTVGGSGRDTPATILATDDGGYLLIGTTTSIDGDITDKTSDIPTTWVVKLGNSLSFTTLRLLVRGYNCQTGSIVFNSTGGDGTPVTYAAPGITRTNTADNFGTVEPGLRNDPKVITIMAIQSGHTVSYAFDLDTYCRNQQLPADSLSTDPLTLSPPTYNCQTGALTFHATGSLVSSAAPIEYRAAGVTDWTTNPNQFVDSALRTAYDAQPILLMARQKTQMATYEFNIKAACGRARIGSAEPNAEPTISLLGNPVQESLSIEITGVENQSLLLQLRDIRGRLVEQRAIEQAKSKEQQTFDIRQQAPGVFLLHTTINDQIWTVKIVKQ